MKKLLITAIAALFAGCTAGADSHSPRVEFLNPPDANPDLPFSAAVRVDNLVFLSGNIGNLPGTLDLPDGGIQAETRQTMENIKSALDLAGATMADVVKCTVFMADMSEWGAMNEVYRTYFETPPARSALGASGLALGALVEIECIAAVN